MSLRKSWCTVTFKQAVARILQVVVRSYGMSAVGQLCLASVCHSMHVSKLLTSAAPLKRHIHISQWQSLPVLLLVVLQIKARKLHELAVNGVPEKYQAELARMRIKSAR